MSICLVVDLLSSTKLHLFRVLHENRYSHIYVFISQIMIVTPETDPRLSTLQLIKGMLDTVIYSLDWMIRMSLHVVEQIIRPPSKTIDAVNS